MASTTIQQYSDYQYLIAYAAFIMIVMLFIRTRFGYVTVYYSLILFAFSLVLLNGNFLANILKPISGNQ